MAYESSVPVAFASYGDLQKQFGLAQPVPGAGKGNAWVVRGKSGGKMLFVNIHYHRTNLRAVWEAAFGPLPNGYEVRTVFPPDKAEPTGLVVIAIIAVLIGLLLPAVQKVAGGAGSTPTYILPYVENASLRFS